MKVDFGLSGGGSSPIFDFFYQVDPSNRTATASIAGIYEVSAKLRGPSVLVHGEATFNTLNFGDSLSCSSTVDQGPPQPLTNTLFQANQFVVVFFP